MLAKNCLPLLDSPLIFQTCTGISMPRESSKELLYFIGVPVTTPPPTLCVRSGCGASGIGRLPRASNSPIRRLLISPAPCSPRAVSSTSSRMRLLRLVVVIGYLQKFTGCQSYCPAVVAHPSNPPQPPHRLPQSLILFGKAKAHYALVKAVAVEGGQGDGGYADFLG